MNDIVSINIKELASNMISKFYSYLQIFLFGNILISSILIQFTGWLIILMLNSNFYMTYSYGYPFTFYCADGYFNESYHELNFYSLCNNVKTQEDFQYYNSAPSAIYLSPCNNPVEFDSGVSINLKYARTGIFLFEEKKGWLYGKMFPNYIEFPFRVILNLIYIVVTFYSTVYYMYYFNQLQVKKILIVIASLFLHVIFILTWWNLYNNFVTAYNWFYNLLFVINIINSIMILGFIVDYTISKRMQKKDIL